MARHITTRWGKGRPRSDQAAATVGRQTAKDHPTYQGTATMIPLGPQTEYVPVAKCQFIVGEASANDDCKCGEPTAIESVYCAPHHERCYRYPEQGETPK